MIVLHILCFLTGLGVVVATVLSAIKTFVVPRGLPVRLSRYVFLVMRRLFDIRARKANSYEERDGIMALYAPLTLLVLPAVWLVVILLGYMAMYWALGVHSLDLAFVVSGSSLLTLGFATAAGGAATLLTFSEATIGLLLVALLIAYLPTMYTAWSRREAAVALLQVRAGSPPTAAEMIIRYHRIEKLAQITDLWTTWEAWFVDVEESHTSLAPLTFFRSPQPDRSWVTASGAILDAAALMLSTVDLPRDAQAALTLRAGFLALRRIADFFAIPHNRTPQPDDPISVARQEFDAVYRQLAEAGIPVKPDREQAWRDFAGWRVNYDTVLLALAALTMAPRAPWSSDRSLRPAATHKRAAGGKKGAERETLGAVRK